MDYSPAAIGQLVNLVRERSADQPCVVRRRVAGGGINGFHPGIRAREDRRDREQDEGDRSARHRDQLGGQRFGLKLEHENPLGIDTGGRKAATDADTDVGKCPVMERQMPKRHRKIEAGPFGTARCTVPE